MITRRMRFELALADQIVKNGFGENLIIDMTTRMAYTPSVRVSHITIEFSDRKTLEINQQSDRCWMSLVMRGKYDYSIIRRLSYVAGKTFQEGPRRIIKAEDCYQKLNRLVLSMFDDIEDDLKCTRAS